MTGEYIFESQAQVNPSALSMKSDTLVFTATRFYVKEQPELSVAYAKITALDRKPWWLLNSIITVRYKTPQGPAKLAFTAASGVMADEQKTGKIYEFLKKAAGKRAVDASAMMMEYGGFDKKHGTRFMTLILLAVLASGVLFVILMLALGIIPRH